MKTVGAGQKFPSGGPSTSKSVSIKQEDAANEDRTHFVLVTKPKFIKVESGNDNAPPSSPRKTQTVMLEAEEDDDVALMKSSQSSDEGMLDGRHEIQVFVLTCSLFRHSTQTL